MNISVAHEGGYLQLRNTGEHLSDEEYASVVKEWLSQVEIGKLIKIQYAEKKVTHQNCFALKRFQKNENYVMSFIDGSGYSISRSWKDIKVLRKELFLGFPGAFIPPLPSTKEKNGIELFFEFLTNNPYFRTDASLMLFLDTNVHSFKKALAFLKQQQNVKLLNSIGRQRWIEAMIIFPSFRSKSYTDNEESFQKLKQEFDLTLEFLIDFKSKIVQQMKVVQSQAIAANDLCQTFKSLLSVETNLSELACPTGEELKRASGQATNALSAQTNLLCTQYGAPMLRKRLLHRIDQEVSMLNSWKKQLKIIEERAKDLSLLESRILTQKSKSRKAKLRKRYERQCLQLTLIYQGLLGIELNTYRIRRVEVLKIMLQSFADFHILGAHRTYNNWNYQKKSHIFEALLDNFDLLESKKRKSKRFSNYLGALEQRPLLQIKIKDKLVKKQGHFLSPGFLKLVPGEILVGHEIKNGKLILFDAINSKGEQGLVYEENISSASLFEAEKTERLIPENTETLPGIEEIVDSIPRFIELNQGMIQDKRPVENNQILEKSLLEKFDKNKSRSKVALRESEIEEERPVPQQALPPSMTDILKDIKSQRQYLTPVKNRSITKRKSGGNGLLVQLKKRLEQRRSTLIEDISCDSDTFYEGD